MTKRILVTMLAVVALAAGPEIYRWTDAEGHSDNPTDKSKISKINIHV